jgi:hypothetical protein
MSFEDFEGSRALGDPIQLFKFTFGPGLSDYYAYTDSTEEQTVDGITYTPVPIQRDTINADGTLDKSAIKINTDMGTGLAELFRVYPPAYVVSLVIRQGHIGDPDSEFLVVWAGRIVAAQREGGEAVLSAEPVSTSLRRPGLRRHYQYGCPHQLYGPQCRADKASKTVTATVASVTGATVTLDAGWEGAFDPAKFLGGLLEWVNDDGLTDRRTILRISGDTLSLSGIAKDVTVAMSVDVVLGCNHQALASKGGDCEGLHVPEDASTPTNLPNYGGEPWIPVKNPIGTYNNYY